MTYLDFKDAMSSGVGIKISRWSCLYINYHITKHRIRQSPRDIDTELRSREIWGAGEGVCG